MNYAVILRLDEVSEKKILQMIEMIVAGGVNDYMSENKIPPHVTVAAMDTENLNQVISIMDGIVPKLSSGKLIWSSIGVFNPSVLFLAPVVNEYLLHTSKIVNESLSGYDIKCLSYYLPFEWVPHTTVATNLNDQEVVAAFSSIQINFKPLSGHSTRITLVQSKPFKIIKEWDLV